MFIVKLYERAEIKEEKQEEVLVYRFLYFETSVWDSQWALVEIAKRWFCPYVCLRETIGHCCHRSHQAARAIKPNDALTERCLRCDYLLQIREVWLPTLGHGGRSGVYFSIPARCLTEHEWGMAVEGHLNVSDCLEFRGENNPFLSMKPLIK